MPRMAVKPSRPLGVRRWHARCPVCPYVSLPLTCSGHAGDDARRHAEGHRCRDCRGCQIIIRTAGPETLLLPCQTCNGRGWVR